MANQIGEGQWQGLDGKIYASEGEANTQSGNVVIGGGGGGGGGVGNSGFMRGFNAAMGILSFLPGFVANAVGFVFSGLQGFVGRILQSIIFALAAVSFGIMAIAPLLPKEFDTSISSGTLWIIAGFVAVWYFIWHYRAVRCMEGGFGGLLVNPFTIMVFGALFMFLVIVFTPLKNSPIQDFFVLGIPIIAAALVYFISAIPYIKQAAELRRTKQPLPEEDEEERLDEKIFEFIEDNGLVLFITGIVITIGVIAVGIILHSEIFKPLNLSMGLLVIGVCAVLSVMTFIGLKLGYEKKVLRIFVYVAFVIALFGGYCVLRGGSQALPNVFYDIAKLERPAEELPAIVTINKRSTNSVTFSVKIYSVPNKKVGKIIKEINPNEVLTMTGKVVNPRTSNQRFDWVEVTHGDDTGWLNLPGIDW